MPKTGSGASHGAGIDCQSAAEGLGRENRGGRSQVSAIGRRDGVDIAIGGGDVGHSSQSIDAGEVEVCCGKACALGSGRGLGSDGLERGRPPIEGRIVIEGVGVECHSLRADGCGAG